MSDKRLAYKNQPGIVHSEASWVNARRWLQGETEEQAKAALQADISSGKIVVIEKP